MKNKHKIDGFGIDNKINKPTQLDTPWQHGTNVNPNMITRSIQHEKLTKQNLPDLVSNQNQHVCQ